MNHGSVRTRRSIRLQGWDYTWPGAYFVTIVTYGREMLFGDMGNGEMRLSPFGRVADTMWRHIPRHVLHVRMNEFVVMPNHLHGIVCITDDGGVGARHSPAPSSRSTPLLSRGTEVGCRTIVDGNASPLRHGAKPGSLGAIVGNFKSITARRINRMRHTSNSPVWQRNYYEHIVRNERELNAIREYIRLNPSRWAEDIENPMVQADGHDA